MHPREDGDVFDSIFGLPTHILIIHAVVVLGPIAALTAIAYAVRPGWRGLLRWPLVVLAAITGVTGLIAGQSGEALEARVIAQDSGADQLALLHDHTEAGDIAKVLCVVFFILVVVVVFWGLRPGAAGGPVGMISIAATVVVALAMLGSVTLTGHSGAKVAWSDLPAASSAP